MGSRKRCERETRISGRNIARVNSGLKYRHCWQRQEKGKRECSSENGRSLNFFKSSSGEKRLDFLEGSERILDLVSYEFPSQFSKFWRISPLPNDPNISGDVARWRCLRTSLFYYPGKRLRRNIFYYIAISCTSNVYSKCTAEFTLSLL